MEDCKMCMVPQIQLDVNHMMSATLGERGISEQEVAALRDAAEKAYENVRAHRGQGWLGWTELPYNQEAVIADIEKTVARIGAVAIPRQKPRTDAIGIDAAQITIAVAYRERHGCVVAPGAHRLSMGTEADHPGALERIPPTKLKRNPQRIANGLAVYTVSNICHDDSPCPRQLLSGLSSAIRQALPRSNNVRISEMVPTAAPLVTIRTGVT